jgi:glycosyltransferase involved in cell wall biosynthesis
MLGGQPSGLGVYSQNVLVELVKQARTRHRLTVYTPSTEPLSGMDQAGLTVCKVPGMLNPRYGAKAALARFVWSQTVFPSILADRYDVLYSPTHHGLLRKGPPQIITVHDLLALKFPSQYRLQYYYFIHVLPRVIRHSSAVIVDSESTKRDVHEHYGLDLDRIFVVYSAVNQGFQPASLDSQRHVKQKYGLSNYILIVGASYPHKNVVRALQAFARVRSALPKMEVVVAGGRPPYTETVRQEAHALNLQEVKFLGYVPPSELPALYSGARVLLYPSYYEGFGLPPLEAMACGCPVIVSHTSSLPEVCGDAACYVDPYDTGSIAESLRDLLTNEAAQEELRRKGSQRVGCFSWERTARDILKVVESVGRSVHA